MAKESDSVSFVRYCSCRRLHDYILSVLAVLTAAEFCVFFVLNKDIYCGHHSSETLHHTDTSTANHYTEPLTEHAGLASERYLLVIGILTMHKRLDRREAIRETWSNHAKGRSDVLIEFYTDSPEFLNEDSKKMLIEENAVHGDLVYMPHPPEGGNFGLRLLWMIERVHSSYNFSFFMRLDDDHFLCLDRLLYELPSRPASGLIWGFVHCHPGIVRVDEAWLILSFDLVEEFVQKSKDLMCTPFADQSVALWLSNSSKNITYFMDNKRIVHKSSSRDPVFLQPSVCERFLSLHGSYPAAMRKYWILTQNFRRRWRTALSYKIDSIQDFETACRVDKKFNVNRFIPGYRFQPKLCSSNPTWNLKYIGREDGEAYTSY